MTHDPFAPAVIVEYGLTLGQADRLAAAQAYTRDDAHRGVSILINALNGICPELGFNAPCTLLPVTVGSP